VANAAATPRGPGLYLDNFDAEVLAGERVLVVRVIG
jgi:hypothetical protein